MQNIESLFMLSSIINIAAKEKIYMSIVSYTIFLLYTSPSNNFSKKYSQDL